MRKAKEALKALPPKGRELRYQGIGWGDNDLGVVNLVIRQ
jgi:hypothetical protein